MPEDNRNMSDETTRTTQWVELVSQLFDRLSGTSAEATYTFENLQISMPKAYGPNGKELGSASWTLNGKVTITAETHKD